MFQGDAPFLGTNAKNASANLVARPKLALSPILEVTRHRDIGKGYFHEVEPEATHLGDVFSTGEN
jgi:hypothetical protein